MYFFNDIDHVESDRAVTERRLRVTSSEIRLLEQMSDSELSELALDEAINAVYKMVHGEAYNPLSYKGVIIRIRPGRLEPDTTIRDYLRQIDINHEMASDTLESLERKIIDEFGCGGSESVDHPVQTAELEAHCTPEVFEKTVDLLAEKIDFLKIVRDIVESELNVRYSMEVTYEEALTELEELYESCIAQRRRSYRHGSMNGYFEVEDNSGYWD